MTANAHLVHQQRVVAQMAPLLGAGLANKVPVKPGHADLQPPALHRDRPHPPVTLDEGVLHVAAFAKYAFSGSMFPRSMASADHLFPECRTPSSRAPVQHAAGQSPSARHSHWACCQRSQASLSVSLDSVE